VTLIECKLETGRTHQIRAHMKYLGHPLFNDLEYGGDTLVKGTSSAKYKKFIENCFTLIPGQALHAKTLGFNDPETHKFLRFDSDLPSGFNELLGKWRNYVQTEEL
jgi:23S rRNA pseudouridine1911/1915/1917 synthase